MAFPDLTNRSLAELASLTGCTAVVTGVAVGMVLMVVLLFGEALDPLRLSAIGLVVAGKPSSRPRRSERNILLPLPMRTRSDMLNIS